ncbi:hypothetical protein VAE151_560891 [Vibrio aestuarianus]|uniref:Uncharacterized protein n=1 Tax=Vibrio aestuarianus TaxID=28171 RepID=A0ABN8TUC1_9VIBR|nr:hypothetical protein VAE308_1051536 [Vibrio aestuarianus]CAH8210851.1 hypothetical protein VIBAE_A32127 [Vibrio aestuarianus subsp. francensis]CAH8211861.1 hypothetical protein VAE055_380883 [Vibrio aestuarianus]CAH8211912.1 hypothetical protein VAE032_271531 [Vibrio aestuarianus]CAH8212072.1 hypothetical protein VAE128_461535 [Vibrio aestuarianus]
MMMFLYPSYLKLFGYKRLNMIEESGVQLSQVVTESHNSTQTLTSLSNELELWVNKFTIKN